MIIGVGVDVHDIRDIERRLHDPDMQNRFTVSERRLCDNRLYDRASAYAKRFVAKEAAIKALGVNDAVGGVEFKDIEVLNTNSGRPTLEFWGGAQEQLASITPEGMRTVIHVSLTDYFPIAVALVTIHAYPR